MTPNAAKPTLKGDSMGNEPSAIKMPSSVPVPANDAIVSMVHQIQDGNRLISMANLADPVFKNL